MNYRAIKYWVPRLGLQLYWTDVSAINTYQRVAWNAVDGTNTSYVVHGRSPVIAGTGVSSHRSRRGPRRTRAGWQLLHVGMFKLPLAPGPLVAFSGSIPLHVGAGSVVDQGELK